MQKKPVFAQVRIGINGIETASVERARAADDAMDFIALLEQQFRHVRTVLPRDAGNERILTLFSSWGLENPQNPHTRKCALRGAGFPACGFRRLSSRLFTLNHISF